MSASEQMRAMLDQLMGTSRNGPEAGGVGGIKFTDPQVCKSFLMACCPHEILASTRMDLGECSKIHEFALRADYENAARSGGEDYFYDVDACEHLKSFIDDCDRRTELAKKRLAETQEELSAEVTSKAEKVHGLAEEIGKKLAQAEQEGAEGKVDESMKLMEEVEEIRKKKMNAEQEYRNSMPASSYQQQKLRVCEVCSAYLGIHDNDRRLADHFGGKLHLGFIKIREKLDGLLEKFPDRKNKRRESRLKETAQGSGSNFEPIDSRDRGHFGASRFGDRGGRFGEPGRDRDRERDRERRDRDRDRDRDRRRRSRSRDRKRSRSRDRGERRRRSRSRSRDRDRRRRRSRSKDRRRRSRSKDRRRRSRDRSKSSDRFKDSPPAADSNNGVSKDGSAPAAVESANNGNSSPIASADARNSSPPPAPAVGEPSPAAE